MNAGFILLYRQITEWEWYQNPNTFRVFLHCLLMANFTDGRFEGKEVKRGQFVTSLPSLSKQTKLSIQQVRTAIEHLKSTGEITDKAFPKYRIITVVKYNDYQQDNRQNNSQATGNQQATNSQTTGNQQQYNNDNNVIREQCNNVYQDGFMDDADARSIQHEHDQLLEAARNAGFRCTPSENASLIALYAEHGMEKMLSGFQACINNSSPKLNYLKACLSGKPKEKPQEKTKVLPAQNFPQRSYAGYEQEMLSELEREIAEMNAQEVS